MCYNKDASIYSYIGASIISIILFKKGDIFDKSVALYSLIFVQMQLAEYFMWLDQECKNTNHFATVYADITLMLQPVILILSLIIFNNTFIPITVLYLLLTISSLILLSRIHVNIKNNRRLCSKKSINGNLKWDFEIKNEIFKKYTEFYFVLFITLPWLFLKNRFKGIISFCFLSFALLFARKKVLKK